MSTPSLPDHRWAPRLTGGSGHAFHGLLLSSGALVPLPSLSDVIKSAADMATLGVKWLVSPDWPLLIWGDLFESYGINEDQSAFCNMGANICYLQASSPH